MRKRASTDISQPQGIESSGKQREQTEEEKFEMFWVHVKKSPLRLDIIRTGPVVFTDQYQLIKTCVSDEATGCHVTLTESLPGRTQLSEVLRFGSLLVAAVLWSGM